MSATIPLSEEQETIEAVLKRVRKYAVRCHELSEEIERLKERSAGKSQTIIEMAQRIVALKQETEQLKDDFIREFRKREAELLDNE